MVIEHVKGQGIHRKDIKKSQGEKDGQLVTNRQRHGDEGEHVKEGDVTVNQHFPLLPPGPHVAHRHSRTWRGTV